MQDQTNRLPSTTKNIDEVQAFVYPGSKITTAGNSEIDVLHRLSKARGAFAVLQNFWRSSRIDRFSRAMFLESFYMAQSPGRCHNPYATR